ncbi:MAG: transposase [Gammaproteobacteria bacterium]|nr:transposase [Gammaproteobacteria bacterium]
MTKSSCRFAITGDPDLNQTSAHGGVVLWLELLRRTGVLHELPVSVAGRQGWTDGQMILAVALLNVVGYEHVSDVDALEEDASLCRLVRDYEEEMLGLPADMLARRFRGGRGRTFPSANSVHDWLLRFQDEAAGQPRKKGEAVVPKPAAELQAVAAVTRRLAHRLVQVLGLDELTLDMDATVLASGKRDALYTYRSATGKAPGERGYQPLTVFCPELGMVLGSEFRDGNVPAKVRNLELLEQGLAELPPEIKRVGLRADGAGFQQKLIRFCNEPASRPEALRRFGVIGFVCSADLDDGMRKSLSRTPAQWWGPVPGSELECADLDHVSTWGARPAQAGQLLRHVATRCALSGELGLGEDESPATDGAPAYRHRVYLTNHPYPIAPHEGAGPAMETADLVRYAHERCGHGEEVHAVLKQDLAGGLMPSGKFGPNAAWWQLAVLSANLNAVLRHCAFGRDWLWVRMKQVRRHWVHLVARVTRHARVQRLLFQPSRVSRVHRALGRMTRTLAHAPP